MRSNRKTVYILDDNDEFRQSTRWLLEGMGFDVVEYSDPISAIESLQLVDKNSQCCLLLDIRMPKMNGPEVHDVLIKKGVSMPVIYMTAYGDVSMAVSGMSKGALNFLEKPFELPSLETVFQNAFSDSVQLRAGIGGTPDESMRTHERIGSLTPRETQIVQGILGDMTNNDIAEEFNISVKTVELYRSKVMSKLEAKNAAHLVRMVMTCAFSSSAQASHQHYRSGSL